MLVFSLFEGVKKLKELKMPLALAQRLKIQGIEVECEILL